MADGAARRLVLPLAQALRDKLPEADRRRSVSRDRQRLYVERQKNGLRVIPVLGFQVGIVQMLEDDAVLPRCCDHTDKAVATALPKWLHEAVTRHNTARYGLP